MKISIEADQRIASAVADLEIAIRLILDENEQVDDSEREENESLIAKLMEAHNAIEDGFGITVKYYPYDEDEEAGE